MSGLDWGHSAPARIPVVLPILAEDHNGATNVLRRDPGRPQPWTRRVPGSQPGSGNGLLCRAVTLELKDAEPGGVRDCVRAAGGVELVE
jgi:hypothetical protein